MVEEHRTDPPMASRFYALLSVAQYEAVLAALDDSRPHGKTKRTDVPAAVAVASATILAYAFPDRADWLATQSRQFTGESMETSSPGRTAADRVLLRARSDGSNLEWGGSPPTGTGLWFSSANPAANPLRPRWGEVRPWYMSSGEQFRPGPPPAFGSDAFTAALAEVRAISDNRSPKQLAIAQFWADGAGSATPPGHWNQIAADLIERHHFDEHRAAMTLALMNTAVMDAGISCWDAKFHYWFIRPPQADPKITTPVGLPNFPSYTSGHATFSGAASEVLAAVFPGQRREIRSMAEEAAMSRLYAGIHYRFDNEVGLRVGRAIGALAIRRWIEGSEPLHFVR
jgi:membrane-associated phospholipid phosphatase